MITATGNQSAVVESRSALEAAYAAALERYPEGPLPIPAYWGGLRVIPGALEFFQAQANNLQDRLRYTRARVFLAPGAPCALNRSFPSQLRHSLYLGFPRDCPCASSGQFRCRTGPVDERPER